MSSPTRVLVVDDELLNRSLIEAILATEGYEIVEAETGERALEIVATQTIDLILLDMMLPGIDGVEVCRTIRAAAKQPIIPIIVISALSDASSRTRGKEAGADDFLSKPIHPAELVVRCRNLLLLRETYALSEALRRDAETEATGWKFVSEVATAVAGCLDYEKAIGTLYHRLRDKLGVVSVAYCQLDDNRLNLVAAAPNELTFDACIDVDSYGVSQRIVRDSGCELDALPHAMTAHQIQVLPIADRSRLIGLFCIGRDAAFEPTELRMLDALTPHIASAVVNVHSHLAAVATIVARERDCLRVAAALELSEARHHLLFEGSPLPIWIADSVTDRIVTANGAFVALCGYTRAELSNMSTTMFEPSPDNEDRTMLLRCRGDRIAELDVTSHVLTLDDRLVRVAIGVDVTVTRRVQDQLRQAQKMQAVGQLAGGVAHDFNNLLAVILTNAELARETIGDDHPISSDLREIEMTAHRGANLTRQLLTFSRTQSRKVAVIDLDPMVMGIRQMLSRLVGGDIEIACVLGSGSGRIVGDPSQVEQIIVNLVVNARDAMTGGGRITISTEEIEVDESQALMLGLTAGPFVTLAISDTGCGMSPQTIARIFDPFFTTKAVGKGTGLGLSTVFGIVQQSSGAIKVESSPDRGSCFRIWFPRVARVEETTQAPAATVASVTGSETILLVEDDASLRSSIRRQLSAWGYSVLEASDGEHALAQIRQSVVEVDLVLTDLVMPGLDGRRLAAKIQEERPVTRILFMSGYTDHPALAPCELDATCHFIAKPFTSHGLSLAIRSALGDSDYRDLSTKMSSIPVQSAR